MAFARTMRRRGGSGCRARPGPTPRSRRCCPAWPHGCRTPATPAFRFWWFDPIPRVMPASRASCGPRTLDRLMPSPRRRRYEHFPLTVGCARNSQLFLMTSTSYPQQLRRLMHLCCELDTSGNNRSDTSSCRERLEITVIYNHILRCRKAPMMGIHGCRNWRV